MEAEETRRPAAEVLPFVRSLWQALRPVCQRVTVAGSLRRERETVHDAEIVLLPQFAEDLFGEATADYPALDAVIASLVANGTLAWDTAEKRNGKRLKRLVVPDLENFVLELYIADEANFGNILTIRTGNADFTHGLVTARPGGCMPHRMIQRNGYLWRLPSWDAVRQCREHDLIPEERYKVVCPTERDFFRELKLPWIEPWERDEAGLKALREIADSGGLK